MRNYMKQEQIFTCWTSGLIYHIILHLRTSLTTYDKPKILTETTTDCLLLSCRHQVLLLSCFQKWTKPLLVDGLSYKAYGCTKLACITPSLSVLWWSDYLTLSYQIRLAFVPKLKVSLHVLHLYMDQCPLARLVSSWNTPKGCLKITQKKLFYRTCPRSIPGLHLEL